MLHRHITFVYDADGLTNIDTFVYAKIIMIKLYFDCILPTPESWTLNLNGFCKAVYNESDWPADRSHPTHIGLGLYTVPTQMLPNCIE